MTKEYNHHNLPRASAAHAIAVTPSDSTDLDYYSLGLYIGTAGDLAVILRDDTQPVTFTAAKAGYHPLQVKRVMSTNTTATNIVALY